MLIAPLWLVTVWLYINLHVIKWAKMIECVAPYDITTALALHILAFSPSHIIVFMCISGAHICREQHNSTYNSTELHILFAQKCLET